MKETRTVTIIGDQIPADLIEWVAQQVAERLIEEEPGMKVKPFTSSFLSWWVEHSTAREVTNERPSHRCLADGPITGPDGS